MPTLQQIWQNHVQNHAQNHAPCRLVEPFVGGMAVALGLQPKTALLNDLNPHLINFYRWLQRGLEIDSDLENDAVYYYACRERFNQLVLAGKTDGQEAAKLFYFMNRTGYNGLCRFNNKNLFNVPFGRYKTIRYAESFLQYAPTLANWQFSALDFRVLQLEPTDFIYADPPYDVQFTKYSAQDFRWEDQVCLAEWLAAHPGTVVASNQATERIVALYERLKFRLIYLNAPRRISCTGNRQPAVEILALRGA